MAEILILGGTGWLGRHIAALALAVGDSVTCLARAVTGDPPVGVDFVRADREDPGAYASLGARHWDLVVEVSWQPGWVRAALNALAGSARHWIYVSSCSVYAQAATPAADETAELLAPLEADAADLSAYGAAKSACEAASRAAVGDRLLIARPGLIGGPGDPSDRTTYWPARFASAAHEPVLVPATDGFSQVIDVRDLASWLLTAGKARVSGAINAVGVSVPLVDALTIASEVAGFDGGSVIAEESWLQDRHVDYWAGPRSFPLWLPSTEDFAGYSRRSDLAFIQSGGRRRSLRETLSDTLEAERMRGLDRPTKAGLVRSDEVDLIRELVRSGS